MNAAMHLLSNNTSVTEKESISKIIDYQDHTSAQHAPFK